MASVKKHDEADTAAGGVCGPKVVDCPFIPSASYTARATVVASILLFPSQNLYFVQNHSPTSLDSAHVHLNQPGRTSWEGFTSGTLAAVSGGVTTVIDMPLNSIPSTTSVGALEVKIKAARYGWENWRSLEEAQRVLGGNAGARHKSGMGVGAGWGKGRLAESDIHKHEDHDGDVDLEEALEGMPELEMLDDSDEEMALFNEDDPVPIRRMSRSNSRSNSTVGISALAPSTPIHHSNGNNTNGHSNGVHHPSTAKGRPRLLDVLGPAHSFVGKNKGVWCDVGFWGGIVPGNKVSKSSDSSSTNFLSTLHVLRFGSLGSTG